MNKIYKSIWNVVTQSFTAVSESQKSRGKRSKSMKLGGGILLACAFAPTLVLAGEDYSGRDNPSVPNLIFGSRDSALTETGITSIWGAAEFQITTKGAEISSMGGASSLVNYSSIGLAQSLLKAETLWVFTDGSNFNVTVSGSSSDQNTSVKQVLLDGDTKIATLNYAIGGVARDLAINNIDSFEGILDYDKESDTLKGYVWGKEYTYNQNGIAWHSQGNADNKGYEHMWTMSLLTGVEINDGCTLTLDGLGKGVSATKVIDGQNETVTKTQTWSAKVSGSGNITYIGDYGTSDEQRSKDDNLLNIESVLIYADAEGNTYDDKNDYTGTTSITNLTVNLLKDASLGETSKLTITDANVNLAHEGTEIVGKKEQTELSLDVSGDSELSLVDKSRLSVTGDAKFDGKAGLVGKGALFVSGTLTLGGEGLKDESGTYRYSGAIDAETTVLKHVNALGAGSLSTNTLKFELDSTSPSLFSDGVIALQAVEIINSNVEYSSEAGIAPTQTTLTGRSTLTVNGTSQLGEKVYFSKGVATADEIALLKINTTATDPFTGVTLVSDRTNAVVELVGLGSDKTEYNVDGHNNQYQGWVRISNASFTVDENHNHGLSVGNGGILKVKNKDDNTPIEVARLGWAIGGNGTGILDLTEFNFTQASNQPVLKVTDTIQLDALGEIKVNSQGSLSASTMQGNILNWDNFSVEDGGMQTSNSYRIISVANMPEDIASQITLTDIAEGTSTVVDYMNGSTNQKSAEITLGTDVGYVVPGENVDPSDYGVYVFYGMRKINLVGENNEQQSLDLMLAENVDDTLTARITGKGIINVSGRGHQLELNNVRNSFAGNFNVKEGVTVSAHEGSLGAGDVTLDISSNATVNLINSSQESQIIKTLSMQATSKLDIGVDANLFVLNDSTITGTLTGSGTLSVNEGANITVVDFSKLKLLENGWISGDGTLTLTGSTATSNVLNHIGGTLDVDVQGLTLTIGSYNDFEENSSLKLGSSATVTIDKDSDIDGLTSITNDGSTLVFSELTSLTPTLNVANNGKLQFDNSNLSSTANVVSGDSAILDLNSSALWLDSDTLFKSNIDEKSTLRYSMASLGTGALSDVSGTGSLWLDFSESASTVDLTSSSLGKSTFAGVLRFDNASLTIGGEDSVHESIGLMVGKDSTLELNGATIFKRDLSFADESTLDFSSHFDSDLPTSSNAQNLITFENGSSAVVQTQGKVTVRFDTSQLTLEVSDMNQNQLHLIDLLDQESDSILKTLMTGITLKEGQDLETLADSFWLDTPTDDSKTELFQGGKHVADVVVGLGIIGKDDDKDGKDVALGIGGKVTELKINGNETVAFDVSDTLQETPRISASLTGDLGNVLFTDSDTTDDKNEITVSSAANSYGGTTQVQNGVHVRVVNTNGLGKTSLLEIGTDSDSELGSQVTFENQNGQLTQVLQQLIVHDNNTLSLSNSETYLLLTGDQVSRINGKLTGAEQTAIVAMGEDLQITDSADIDEYQGAFAAIEGANIEYEVETGSKTFKNQFAGTGYLKKTGFGELIIDEGVESINVEADEGIVRFNPNDPATQTINSLKLNSNGIVEIGSGSTARIETDGVLVVQDFVGNGGLVAMDVALGTSTEQGSTVEFGAAGNDGLEIQGTASGNANILIRDKNGLKQGAEERIHLVKVAASTEDFDLSLYNGAVTAGAYDYTLVREDRSASGDEVETGSDWYLSSIEGQEQIRNTTVNAGSYIAIASAAQLFDLSLHDRVGNRDWINPVTGEKQSTSLWMHQTFSHERSRDSTNQIRMRNTSSVTMLGGDLVQWTTSGNGMAYAGVMGGYGTMDTKSRSHRTNLRSDADTDAWGVGAYFGWKADSDAFTGPYVDGWVMFTHADSTVEGTDVREDAKGQGLSASIEAGWGFHVGSVKTDNGKTADFHIEPHASAAWFGMNYDDISNETHDVTFEGHNNVRTRLGARVMISERETKNFNVFTEVNWVHNTQEYGATISGLRVDQAGARNQGEARLGVDWRVTDRLSVWARGGASVGDDGYNEREGSVGVRYQF